MVLTHVPCHAMCVYYVVNVSRPQEASEGVNRSQEASEGVNRSQEASEDETSEESEGTQDS